MDDIPVSLYHLQQKHWDATKNNDGARASCSGYSARRNIVGVSSLGHVASKTVSPKIDMRAGARSSCTLMIASCHHCPMFLAQARRRLTKEVKCEPESACRNHILRRGGIRICAQGNGFEVSGQALGDLNSSTCILKTLRSTACSHERGYMRDHTCISYCPVQLALDS